MTGRPPLGDAMCRRWPGAFLPGCAGIIVNPLAASIFFGLILVIVVYSVLDRTGMLASLGPFGPVLPLLIIVWIMVGIYFGTRRLKRRAGLVCFKGPLFMRSLMNGCLKRTCGQLASRLNAPELSSAEIFNAILIDKMLYIGATDCLRFSDFRRQIEGSRIKGTADLEMAVLFQTPAAYRKQPLPDEIRQVADAVSRSRKELAPMLERLKSAHETLCTGTGSLLTLLPPDEKKAEKLRSAHHYRPPTVQGARRMVFALETLAYVRAIRHENVNPMDRKRYDEVAEKLIPQLAEALAAYRQAWQELVDAYERPESERAPSVAFPKSNPAPYDGTG
ncbi:MAG: hypothetical protein CSA23_03615 [Deltaproteobacteria bacterium]|nr:MAG: hypothetical protein CSA23_03615 [Deltaproteobacteria bacterium]